MKEMNLIFLRWKPASSPRRPPVDRQKGSMAENMTRVVLQLELIEVTFQERDPSYRPWRPFFATLYNDRHYIFCFHERKEVVVQVVCFFQLKNYPFLRISQRHLGIPVRPRARCVATLRPFYRSSQLPELKYVIRLTKPRDWQQPRVWQKEV